MCNKIKHAANLIAWATMSLAAVGLNSAASAAGKPAAPRLAIFDIDKRKKTKTQITDWAAYSAYASARYSGERNLNLDDGVDDRSDKLSAYLGVAVRAEPVDGLIGFAHVEAELTHRGTHKNTTVTNALHIREAVAAYRVDEKSVLSLGRMRIADPQKWVADAAVDGVHFGHKGDGTGFDIAAFAGTRDNDGLYALAHVYRFTSETALGGFGVLEARDGQTRAHLSAYSMGDLANDISYALNGGAVIGDGANDQAVGLGIDARVIAALGAHDWNPQLTLGAAAGSKGFVQTELHSNKTYDGGQTQFNRHGYLYQPELTNMAVATVGFGIRPSRMFSLDFTAHAYAQIEPFATVPDARVSGATTGGSALLGGELSVVGAWRPTKKTKFEFGLSIFQAGPAYQNQDMAKQAYARFSVYF